MAGSTGFEPATSGLTVQCANQAAPRARVGTSATYTTRFHDASAADLSHLQSDSIRPHLEHRPSAHAGRSSRLPRATSGRATFERPPLRAHPSIVGLHLSAPASASGRNVARGRHAPLDSASGKVLAVSAHQIVWVPPAVVALADDLQLILGIGRRDRGHGAAGERHQTRQCDCRSEYHSVMDTLCRLPRHRNQPPAPVLTRPRGALDTVLRRERHDPDLAPAARARPRRAFEAGRNHEA